MVEKMILRSSIVWLCQLRGDMNFLPAIVTTRMIHHTEAFFHTCALGKVKYFGFFQVFHAHFCVYKVYTYFHLFYIYKHITHAHRFCCWWVFLGIAAFKVGRLALHQSLGPGSPRVLRHYPGVLHRIILYPVPVAAALFTRHLGKSTRRPKFET